MGQCLHGHVRDEHAALQIDVLQLMARRLSNKEIAGRLHVSLATVKSHALRIYQKLDVHGRRQAVERGVALGILAEP